MLNHLAAMLLALRPLAPSAPARPPAPAAPAAREADGLRIVAVEQAGGPPYVPRDGRLYRLGGDSVSGVRPGEVLIVRRPGEVRDIGLLRVVSVHTENFAANSALARLESRGETFPLKGDIAAKLAPTDMPAIAGAGAPALKGGPPPPLDPPVMPAMPGAAGGPLAAVAAPPPSAPAVLAVRTAAPGAGMPKFLEQNPIYFIRGSSEISPKGVVRLREWTDAWGARAAARGLTYFLAVPQNQLHLRKLTADRLAALQSELRRLGVAAVELRYDEKGAAGPLDVVYVGAEGPAG